MPKAKSITVLNWILIGSSAILLLVLLWWHYKLGMTRYFDVDEYAHLHWTAKILTGKLPYIDFLTFFTPVFFWFLTPAFIGGWGTVAPFLAARFMMFLVFAVIAGLSGYIFRMRRGKVWLAVLAPAIMAFLPLPFDKYLEIRPDGLATVFMLAGILFQLLWMKKGEKRHAFLTGVFYSLSLLTLSKMLPNIAVGGLIALIYIWTEVAAKKGNIKKKLINVAKPVVVGLLVPVVIFGLWALTLGHLNTVIYSLISLPLESNKISKYFIMMPDLFFYPNGIFYGSDGWNQGLIVNLIVWVFAIVVGLFRLLSPYLTGDNKNDVLSELLIAGQFLIQVIFYVEIVPLKHTQYLIPIGVFIGWYAADGLGIIWNYTAKKLWGASVYVGLFLILAIYLYQTFISVNAVKLGWDNAKALADITALYQKIPLSEPILDLDGRMLFHPDAYFACCVPFGQSEEFISHPLPSLPSALEQTNTKYINQGELKRVNTLPWNDQQYIYAHFHTLNGNEAILVRNDVTQ